MSTAYARRLGTAQNLKANGRIWTVERSCGDRMLAELNRGKDGGLSFMPGFWKGQPRLGFATLEGAGYWRRRARDTRDAQHRALFKRRAIDAIFASREMRVTHELMLERRAMMEDVDLMAKVATGVRRAA